MKGSVVLASAETREEVMELLRSDVYATSGTWDLEKVVVYPVSCVQVLMLEGESQSGWLIFRSLRLRFGRGCEGRSMEMVQCRRGTNSRIHELRGCVCV